MQALELAEYLVAHGQFTTVAEAVSVLNLIFVEEVGASGVVNIVTGGAASAVIGAAGQSALDVAATADLVAEAVASRSAAITLMSDGVKAKAAAALGVEYGVAAAAMAPVLGVALGNTLYQANPDLWEKISRTLLPFCYENTNALPIFGYLDDLNNWVTSIPSNVFNALKNLFAEEGIGAPPGEYVQEGFTAEGITFTGQCTAYKIAAGNYVGADNKARFTSVSGDSPVYYYFQSDGDIVVFSESQYEVWVTAQGSFGINGIYNSAHDLYYRLVTSNELKNTAPISPSTMEPESQYILIAAQIIGHLPAGYFPEGTSQWEGVTPSTIPEGEPHVIDMDPLTGVPVTVSTIPISIPPEPNRSVEGWPTPSQTVEFNPDPNTTVDPELQIDPYIQPTQDPTEVTTPTIYPYPQEDPTRPRDPDRVITDTIDPPTPTITDVIPIPSGVVPDPPMPSTPSPFSSVVGMVSVYHPTSAQLYAFEQWLWVTYQDVTIDKIWNNPFDGVISLFELYCTPTDNGSRNIHCGFLDSGINCALVSRYTEIDCGTIGIPEFYGNYLDYSPYSKAHIYLPFIGIQELNVDDIVGHAVNVKYRIDEYNGSCIAMITVAKVTHVGEEEIEYSNIMYQFSGNCAVELPLSGGSQAAIKAGMMQADAYQYASNVSVGASLIGGVASAVGGLLMGALGMGLNGANQIANAATQYASGKANYLSNMLSGKSTVQKSGTFGSSHGALGVKTPFITITRPKQVAVPNYEELYGFPAHKMVTIGACTGFLRCKEVHVISPTATDQEKSMIEAMLKSGVYVTE